VTRRHHPSSITVVLLSAAIVVTVGLSALADSALVEAGTTNPYRVEVVQTNADLSQRLTRLPDIVFGPAATAAPQAIAVNAGRRYQRISGFGAAMTDTSAWLIERQLSPARRTALIDELFGTAGLHLGLVRIPVGASDFTHDGHPYTYDDMPAGQSDPQLRHFSIAHDTAYILPALSQARAVNPQLQLTASPWTAPAWMKANDALDNLQDRGTLRSSDTGAWAAYLARFVAAYRQAGVPISALTVQNEPTVGTAYPGMSLPADQEARLIDRDLEPALARAGAHPQIDGGDLGWNPNSAPYMRTVTASRTLGGLAWHCYYGLPTVMAAFHAAYPRLTQTVDECSPGGPSPTPTAEVLISSLREWAAVVMLWNLALDPNGGPVQPPNHGCPRCVGLATVDEHAGTATLSRSAYQLGQVSAFVQPGAQRIASNTFVSYDDPHAYASYVTPGLDDVALRNPDGSIVLIAYNSGAASATFAVRWRARAFTATLAPGAMTTFVWNQP
jgi:glucosylceramidase